MLKDRPSKISGWQFLKWLFGPEEFSGLSRNGPLDPIAAPKYLWPSLVMLIAVYLKISLAASSFSGLAISQHFLALAKYPSAESPVDSSSHHFFTSSSDPDPVASTAYQHCFAELEVLKRVFKGCRLTAYRLPLRCTLRRPQLFPSDH